MSRWFPTERLLLSLLTTVNYGGGAFSSGVVAVTAFTIALTAAEKHYALLCLDNRCLFNTPLWLCYFSAPNRNLPPGAPSFRESGRVRCQVVEVGSGESHQHFGTHLLPAVPDAAVSWWRRRDSNPRPPECDSGALPG